MPLDPWEIRTDDTRKEDSIANYIIFCEDENSEPIYFESFRIEGKLKINAIPNQKSSKLNLEKAIEKCIEDGLMEVVDGGLKLKEGSNVWCVYDRDVEIPVDNSKDQKFTTAIQDAANYGIKVGWSNDAFELWVLLHFDTVPTGAKLHRDEIYRQLTEVFKNINDPSPELALAASKENFYYKDFAKRKVHFIPHVLPKLKEKENIERAIVRAAAMEALYTPLVPFHDRNPCTMVHKLVQELLAFREVE